MKALKKSSDARRIFATGTETGTGDKNQNENGNEDETRTEPEVQEEESGPASPVFNQAHKPPARGQRTGKNHQKRPSKNHQKRPRMIVSKHPIVKETQLKQAKSKKSLELDSDDGEEVEFGDLSQGR